MWQTPKHIIESHERDIGRALSFDEMVHLLTERLAHLDHSPEACRDFAKAVYINRYNLPADESTWHQRAKYRQELKQKLERAGRI